MCESFLCFRKVSAVRMETDTPVTVTFIWLLTFEDEVHSADFDLPVIFSIQY
jgi:hypothetical protein